MLLAQENLYRYNEKIDTIAKRLEALEAEKVKLEEERLKERLKAREEHAKKLEMRRMQSAVYKRLNPLLDYEINYEDFEKALQQVNNNLINKKECNYVYHVSMVCLISCI